MKTKHLLLSLAVAMMGLSLSAAPVDLAHAKATAKQFLNRAHAGKMMAPAASEPVLLKQVMGDINKNTPVFYIFNTSSTFVIVSGDDRAEEILAVGDNPLTTDKFPPNMQAWLDGYKNELDWLISNPDVQVEKSSSASAPRAVTGTYGPLLTCYWDQTAPYWNLCKFTYSGTTYQCYTGCPATSASMVMYYWKWPIDAVPALPSYSASLDLSYWNSVNFTYPSLPSVTFDWDNMKDAYGSYKDNNDVSHSSSYTTAQGNAVATLMRYVGQAEKMMYGTAEAGGSGIYSTDAQVVADMFILFGYDETTCRLAKKSSYSTTNWANLLQQEMAEGRPVVFMAVASSAGGHAFNVDGYRSSDSKYHINFGWSGEGNNWCVMNSFKDDEGYNFNQDQQMIIGIQPPATGPHITASPSSVTFDELVGDTYTQAVNVRGRNLEGNITATLSGSNTFSINTNSIAQSNGTAEGTITVSYTPTASGTHTATLTLKSSNAETVTVPISATATMPPPTITATPKTLSFGTVYTNTDNPLTFNVKGVNLNGNITATLTDPNGVFALSATTITKAEAAGGKDITVTFNPKAEQNYTGSIKLTSSGATTVTVNLSGTGKMLKAVPVMLPANENYIQNTSFRADWTDETPAANVASYTLRVNKYDPTLATLLIEETFAKFTTTNNYSDIGSKLDNYMDNNGWTGTKVFSQVGAIRVGTKTYAGSLTSPALDLTDSKGKLTVKMTMLAPDNNNPQVVISCGNASQTITVPATATEQTIVLDVAEQEGQKITFSSAKNQRFDISALEIYSGDASDGSKLRAVAETGDATMRIVTGITNHYYLVQDLAAGGTYSYRVKVVYIDGTESNWSRAEQVTLGQSGGLKGDIDGNGTVDVSDVNIAVSIILGKESRADYVSRADMDGSGSVDISDVNQIVNIILGK